MCEVPTSQFWHQQLHLQKLHFFILLHSYIQKRREIVLISVIQRISLPLRMLYLQRGQVALIRSHLTMHVEWKWWLHGSAWSSVPSSYGVRQMQHSWKEEKNSDTAKIYLKSPCFSSMTRIIGHPIHRKDRNILYQTGDSVPNSFKQSYIAISRIWTHKLIGFMVHTWLSVRCKS